MLKSKFKKTHLFWIIPVSIITLVILSILAVFGVSALQTFNEHRYSEKIYSVGDLVEIGPLSFKVNKTYEDEVSLIVPREKIEHYGDVQQIEDCNKYPFFPYGDVILSGNSFEVDEVAFEKTNHAAKYCKWRNEERAKITSYQKEFQRLFIDYELAASSTVDTKLISIEVIPDSGRDVKKSGERFDYSALLSKNFVPAFDFSHQSYVADELGGSINRGITRTNRINLDTKSDEKTVDLKLVYDGKSRIVRIAR